MRRRLPLWVELAGAILLALIASNAVTFAIVEYRRAQEVRAERLSAIEQRLTALVGLLSRLPASEHDALLKVASVRRERVSLGERPRVAHEAARDAEAEGRLKAALAGAPVGDVRVAKRGTPDWTLFGPRPRTGLERFSAAIAIKNGQWLNAEFVWPQGASLLPGLLLSAVVASVLLIAVAAWVAYRVSRPLQRLSQASSDMLEGRSTTAVPETGPFVLRNAAAAFNTMSRRLMAMLENQRVLLASIAHDLRTPITSLRIKSEFIADGDLRARMEASLDELQTVTEAALDAARTGIGEEAAREVDVSALVESVCADLADIGRDVTFEVGASAPACCRPNEIKRAARNLIENAVRHGVRARVAVAALADAMEIRVDDDGPGLRPDEIERVFDPFVRLEGSRGRETGGLGLGLTLARAVGRGHGGDVTLTNRGGGGLRATLTFRPIAAV